MEDIKRKLSKDIDISTMLSMREQGMTNKQIADALGVHPNTVYRYIGRMSQAVKYAEITNKPSPIAGPVSARVEEPKRPLVAAQATTHTHDSIDASDATDEEKTPQPPLSKLSNTASAITGSDSLLRVISTRSTLQGSLCNYIVDSNTGTIEMTDGLISGLLDRETIQRFIAELQEASKLLG